MYVYLLQSRLDPKRHYVGITGDISSRLRSHNAGQVKYTSKYKPWEIIVFCWFNDEAKAFKFEQYLKSGSGRAFSKKHF